MSDNQEPSMVPPHHAIIVCNNREDEHVKLFEEHFKEKQLNYEVVVEKDRFDIDIKFYDVLDTLVDNIGLPHKG